jgi:nicotinamidase-related amidase
MTTNSLEQMKTNTPGAADPAVSRRHALMLIDFQYDFLASDGRMPVARNQVLAFVAATQLAVTSARKVGDPIIAIGNEFRRSDRLMNLLRRGASIAGSAGARWDERLPLDQIEYLPKWASSAFVNPALEKWLDANRVSSLTLAGLQAKACVAATAKEALRRGFSVRILADAVACVSDKSRSSALARLERRGVAIGSAANYDVWPIELS